MNKTCCFALDSFALAFASGGRRLERFQGQRCRYGFALVRDCSLIDFPSDGPLASVAFSRNDNLTRLTLSALDHFHLFIYFRKSKIATQQIFSFSVCLRFGAELTS